MKARVLTAVLLIPLVLAVVGCSKPGPLYGLLFLVAFGCALEALELFSNSEEPSYEAVPMLVLLGVLSAPVFVIFSGEKGNVVPAFASRVPALLPAAVTLLFLGIWGAWEAAKSTGTVIHRGLAVFWFAVPLVCLGLLHPLNRFDEWSIHWPTPTLAVLLPVWAGDTAAMLAGKAFGKHRMAPTISPSKTWEGAISNFIVSVLAGWGVGAWLGYELWVGLACGAAVGTFGQLGDLFESALKRAAGKKDSGTLLPGHGGLLDRIDALLGSVIPVWLILHFSGSLR